MPRKHDITYVVIADEYRVWRDLYPKAKYHARIAAFNNIADKHLRERDRRVAIKKVAA